MSDSERLVRLELLGQEFSFYTGESDENLEAILKLVRSALMGESRVTQGAIPTTKVAVLGCLTLAAEHVKLQREFDEYRKVSKGRIVDLSENIQRCLGDE